MAKFLTKVVGVLKVQLMFRGFYAVFINSVSQTNSSYFSPGQDSGIL